MTTRWKHVVAVLLIISVTACAVVSRRVEVSAIDQRKPVNVTSPVKAHLKDGSTVVYPQGVTVTRDALQGEGTRHDITLKESTSVTTIPLDSVVGMEAYTLVKNQGETVVLSTLATAAGTVGTLFAVGAAAVAIFGSCPTVYSADGSVEEAELFSSSIAPLFEGRDLDLLKTIPGPDGVLSLDIRNEMMETHYINHLQLVEVQHGAGETVMPDAQGGLLALGRLHAAPRATDRRGRDVTALLAKTDGTFYVADRAVLDHVSASDMDDWIDVIVPVPAGAKSAALAFRMRNSLLNTVLLYNVMLAPAGAGALGWMSGDLGNISTAVELGRWLQRRAGLHISVWDNGKYREVVRVPDSGPISWHDVAAVVPVPYGETELRVRLSFLTDHWRIDRVGISTEIRSASTRIVPLSAVQNAAGKPEVEALTNMSSPDERYLQTNPGDHFYARFATGPAPAGRQRSFLLSSQGYYTEWIRGSWLRDATVATPFAPSDAAILTALEKWRGMRDSFEQQFFNNRVPVR